MLIRLTTMTLWGGVTQPIKPLLRAMSRKQKGKEAL